MAGTPFQNRVWKEIKKIPAGQTRTYKEIAVSIGNPRSSRAVANACAANPNPIIVPCHRVIRSDGSYGGYSGPGGTSGKSALISSEREITSRNT
tara:strand:- start:119 stop:400 length:282 start_codon:yes stop_codon:yes gene_type:complete